MHGVQVRNLRLLSAQDDVAQSCLDSAGAWLLGLSFACAAEHVRVASMQPLSHVPRKPARRSCPEQLAKVLAGVSRLGAHHVGLRTCTNQAEDLPSRLETCPSGKWRNANMLCSLLGWCTSHLSSSGKLARTGFRRLARLFLELRSCVPHAAFRRRQHLTAPLSISSRDRSSVADAASGSCFGLEARHQLEPERERCFPFLGRSPQH